MANPTSDDMVERVARAIYAHRMERFWPPRGRTLTYDELSPEMRQKEVASARAAIAAMREPTEAMYAAAACYEWPAEIMRAMVDAALKPKTAR